MQVCICLFKKSKQLINFPMHENSVHVMCTTVGVSAHKKWVLKSHFMVLPDNCYPRKNNGIPQLNGRYEFSPLRHCPEVETMRKILSGLMNFCTSENSKKSISFTIKKLIQTEGLCINLNFLINFGLLNQLNQISILKILKNN